MKCLGQRVSDFNFSRSCLPTNSVQVPNSAQPYQPWVLLNFNYLVRVRGSQIKAHLTETFILLSYIKLPLIKSNSELFLLSHWSEYLVFYLTPHGLTTATFFLDFSLIVLYFKSILQKTRKSIFKIFYML